MRGWAGVSCAAVAVALAVPGATGAGALVTVGPPGIDDEAGATLSPGAPGSGPASTGDNPAAAALETALGRERPIAESVDRAVDELIRRHFSSCGRAEGGDVPCFPIAVEREWQYSVAHSLEHLELDDRPTPGRPPTVGEMSGSRPGPQSASGGVSLDPVCKGRQLLKAITGRSRTYYLYRMWDAEGEHAVLREQPMKAAEWTGSPDVHYVELGSFGDECEALAAWRKALRQTRARGETGRGEEAPAAVEEDSPPGEPPSGTAVSDPPR